MTSGNNDLKVVRDWLAGKLEAERVNFDEVFTGAQLTLGPAHDANPWLTLYIDWTEGEQLKTLSGRGENIVEAARSLLGALSNHAKRT